MHFPSSPTPRPYRSQPPRRQSAPGFGLIEALVAATAAALMAAAALPQLAGMVELHRLRAASADWSRVVSAARDWAFNQQRDVRLDLHRDGSACLLLHDGARGACTGCLGAAVCQSGVRLLARTQPLPRGLAATANSASQAWSAGPRVVTPTGTWQIALADGRAIHHVVNVAGRMRVCSPQGRVSGLAAC